MPDFPFMDFLEEIPELGYFSEIAKRFPYAQGGQTRTQGRYWEGQQGNEWNRYMGQVGQQVRGGQAPTLRWTDYLKDSPFTKRYASLPPQYRGNYSPTRLAPRTRWLLY